MPNSPNYTRRRVLTIAIATAASPATVLSLNAGGPADRRVVAESRFDVTSAPLPAEADIVQEVSDLASGWRAERASVGFTANIIIAGEVTCQIGAERKVHKAGEAWSAPAGTLLGEENTSASTARVFTTYLLPRGA